MSLPPTPTPEQEFQLKLETAKKCGCRCHYYEARHCIPCCNATYFRVDLAETEESKDEVV